MMATALFDLWPRNNPFSQHGSYCKSVVVLMLICSNNRGRYYPTLVINLVQDRCCVEFRVVVYRRKTVYRLWLWTAVDEIETETNRLHYGMEAVALLHLFSTSATNVALLPPSGKYWNCVKMRKRLCALPERNDRNLVLWCTFLYANGKKIHILEPATRKAFTDLCHTTQMYDKWNVFQCRSINLSFTATQTQLFIQL